MIKSMLVILFCIGLINASPVEVTYFTPKSADFTSLQRIPEMEFQSYLENHPSHMIQSPLVIMKFIPPTPYYELEGSRIVFFNDRKLKKKAGVYNFHLVYGKRINPVLAIGSKKSYSPFGDASPLKKTFYFLLPGRLSRQNSFVFVYEGKVNGHHEKDSFRFYYSPEKGRFVSDKEKRRNKLYRSLKNQNHFVLVDHSGDFYFDIEHSGLENRANFSVEVKNLSSREKTIHPEDFNLVFKDYQVLEPFMSSSGEGLKIPPGGKVKMKLVFKLPELPKYSKVYGTLRFIKGGSSFEKKIPFS